MRLFEKFFSDAGEKREESFEQRYFAAKIIFDCELVLQNNEKVKAAVEEFVNKFPDRIAENPRITHASDGNVVELTLLCQNKDEILEFNKELELVARRYGLR